MTLLNDVFATQIIIASISALLIIVALFLSNEFVIAKNRVISFKNYPRNVQYYNVPEQGILSVFLGILLFSQAIFILLTILSAAYLFSVILLINSITATILLMYTFGASLGNRDLSLFTREYQKILKLEELGKKQEEQAVVMSAELDTFRVDIETRKSEFKDLVSVETFTRSAKKYGELEDILLTMERTNVASTIPSLQSEFEDVVNHYIATSKKKKISDVATTLEEEKTFYDIIDAKQGIINDDTKDLAKVLFADFSKYDESQIIQIIDLATKYRFSVTAHEIDQILERVKSLSSKSELLNRLYSSNAITAPIVIRYLEQDQDWIITPQMYDILKPGELSNILSLLVEKDLYSSAKKFLQQLPALKLQILYRVTREVINPTSELILEFREFLPLKFLFSDPSTMYFNMYNALIGVGDTIGDQLADLALPLGDAIIQNKEMILHRYQDSYEESADLRRQFEGVKLNLLSSNLRQSLLIRLETAMELFYQYVVNLKVREAQALFNLLEAVFLIEETDRLKTEEYLANRGTAVAAATSISKHVDNGKAKLKRIIKTEATLMKQIISRVEQSRLSYDRLLEMVR